jgi:hypothetical protein
MGIGTGVHLYALAFKAWFIAWQDLLARTPLSPMFPSYFLGHAAAGGLFCIGAIAYGGVLGVLGACLSAWWTVMYLWIASVMRKAVVAGPMTED